MGETIESNRPDNTKPKSGLQRGRKHLNKRDGFARSHGYSTTRLLVTALVDGVFFVVRRDTFDHSPAIALGYKSMDELITDVVNGVFFEQFDIKRKTGT